VLRLSIQCAGDERRSCFLGSFLLLLVHGLARLVVIVLTVMESAKFLWDDGRVGEWELYSAA
jgi:hypothetical protein